MSNTSTLRNRKFLRKYEPVRPHAEKRLTSDDMKEPLKFRNSKGPHKNVEEGTVFKGNSSNEGGNPLALPIMPDIEDENLPRVQCQ